jgi:hypothetical protein
MNNNTKLRPRPKPTDRVHFHGVPASYSEEHEVDGKLNKKRIKFLHGERTEIPLKEILEIKGYTLTDLFKDKENVPKGLTRHMVRKCFNNRTKTMQRGHLAWLFKSIRNLKSKEICERSVSDIQIFSILQRGKKTKSVYRLMREATDVPVGLSPNIAYNIVKGRSKKYKRDHRDWLMNKMALSYAEIIADLDLPLAFSYFAGCFMYNSEVDARVKEVEINYRRSFFYLKQKSLPDEKNSWKFHISLPLVDLFEGWGVVTSVLLRRNMLRAKVMQLPMLLDWIDEGTYDSSPQRGKVITIYDCNFTSKDWQEALQEIETAFKTRGLVPGPAVRDDRKVAGSQFIYYRCAFDAQGNYLDASEGELNNYPPEQRFNPAGLPDPFAQIKISDTVCAENQLTPDPKAF